MSIQQSRVTSVFFSALVLLVSACGYVARTPLLPSRTVTAPRTQPAPTSVPRTPLVLTSVSAMRPAVATPPLHPRLSGSLGPVAIGMSMQDVLHIWGKPQNETITHGIGTPEWSYPQGVVLGIRAGRSNQQQTIWKIVGRAPYDGQTHEGIHIGDTEAAVRKQYHGFALQTFENPHQVQIVDTNQTTLNVLFDPHGTVTMIFLSTCLECNPPARSGNTPDSLPDEQRP